MKQEQISCDYVRLLQITESGKAIEKYMVTDIFPFRVKNDTHSLAQLQLIKSSIKNACGFAGLHVEPERIVFHHYGFANNCFYMIDKAERFSNIHQLIHDKRYFILRTPRQTGKTTAMLQMMDEFNSRDDYISLYINVEAGQAWLVNAIGRELCFDDYALDKSHEITPSDVDEKVEILIQRKDVHLINKVLEAYIEFYKEHSELVTKRKTYAEAAHHLLFMAWLQRIVNSGGTIAREYAAGLGRLDLCINFAGERFAFERL